MVDAPGLVERRVDIAGDQLVADVTLAAEQLKVVRFAVGQALLLVVAAAQERLFAFRANCGRAGGLFLDRRAFCVEFHGTDERTEIK